MTFFFKTNLFKNIIHLTFIQGVSFLIPLITMPYLIRVLGFNNYGMFILTQAIAQYVLLFSDFGFNLSSTKKVARNQNNELRVSIIFWSTIFGKFILFLISFPFVFSFLFFFYDQNEYSILFLMFIPQMLAGVATPNWLFQGKERMKVLSLLTVSSKLIYIILIFSFVKSKGDLFYVALAQGASSFFVVLASLYYVYKSRWVTMVIFDLRGVIINIRGSFVYFISVASVSLYTTLPTLIIGFILGESSVAYYNIANTIRNAMQSLLNPIYQAIFPRVNNLYKSNKIDTVKFIKRSLFIIPCISLSFSIFIFFTGQYLILFFAKEVTHEVVVLLKVLCFIPFISSICNILGVQSILVFGFKKYFTCITVLAGLFNLATIYPLTISFGLVGSAISVLITELFILVSFFSFIKIKKIY
ncbi:TPA: flippase [Klebsiella pneumoniae]